jgi:hypothetical protein
MEWFIGLRIAGILGILAALAGVGVDARAAEYEASASPFADKPCSSYSAFKDSSGQPGVLIWGKAPFEDFGSREIEFNEAGVRQLRPAPAAGVHPRILFGPDDLEEVRHRVKQTQCGQEAWKNILSWTEMMKGNYDDKADYAQPDRWQGGFGGLHGRVPLFRLGIPRAAGAAYNHNPQAAQFYRNLIDGNAEGCPSFYWNVLSLEAFRCLIDNDQSGAENAAKATITLMKADQAKRDADPKTAGKTPDQPVGAFQLAFIFDFIFNWLTPEQKQQMHDELALSTWSHDNYGTFNTADTSRSNWATFSYWLFEVLGIEGEPGFNDLKVRGMYRGWRNLLTYGWFKSGATYEGEAKNQLGMDGIILFATRQKAYGFQDLCGHPYLQAYARSFLPESLNSMLTGFHKYDLLGGSRTGHGGFTPNDLLGLKFMFPNDRVIDFVYRKSIGDDYSGVPDRPDGYFNALLFYAVYASDFMPDNSDPAKLGLSNTFFCGERALLMTRSSWDKDAMMLNMHTRQANGGHPFSDRNGIMVSGAGRIWSPNGYANFRTSENSVVCIDGKSQTEQTPGRMVDFQDSPLATFATGDAKYCWDWSWKRLQKNKGGYYTKADVDAGSVVMPPNSEPERHTTNDFAYLKLPFAYLNRPMFENPDWILPNGAISPIVRMPNYPVERAFRTAGLVRGKYPYALVVDDIQKDESVHHYDWTLTLEYDIQIAAMRRTNAHEMDILLTGSDPDQLKTHMKEALPSAVSEGTSLPNGTPMLLVRVLNYSPASASGAEDPKIVELPNIADPKKYSTIRRLVIPADAVSPDFKVLLYAYHNGAPLPTTKWDGDRRIVTVTWPGQHDTSRFGRPDGGKTPISIARDAQKLIEMKAVVKPLD